MAPVHGSGVTAYGALAIAEEYKRAAELLGADAMQSGRMPHRLLALHALERFLRAHLLHTGQTPEAIRDFRHDIEKMRVDCEAHGLRISKQSRHFITAVAAEGDYVRVRYDTGVDYRGGDWPPLPRPNASMKLLIEVLDDVSTAVKTIVTAQTDAPATVPKNRSPG